MRVGIAILTWNGEALTRQCLETLSVLTQWPVPTAIIDNGSSGPEGERLAAEFGDTVESIRLDPNRGVPGGYNAGIRWAAARSLSHVLLLNNDVLMVDPNLLSYLLRSAGPDVAAVGPITLARDRSVASAGGTLSWWTGLSGHRRQPLHRRIARIPRLGWMEHVC